MMNLLLPLRNWARAHLSVFKMSETQALIVEAGLLARIRRCEQFKERVARRFKELGPDITSLDGRTYDEWMMIYDVMIIEAQSELKALKSGSDEEDFLRIMIMAAAALTLTLLLIMLLALASPLT